MGYTRYWEGAVVCSDAVWDQIIDEFMAVGVKSKVKLASYTGSGLATLSKTEFAFNGEGKLGHESVNIRRGQNEFGFCKTAQKPYDILVCALLIIMQHRIRTFKVSSDGGPADWADAIALCQDVLGYGVYPCRKDDDPEPAAGDPFIFKRMIPEGVKEKPL